MEILTIGERILLYRHRAKLTKKDFAEKAGISVSTLTKYENDRINHIDEAIITQMSLVLGISANKLQFGFEDVNKRIPKKLL